MITAFVGIFEEKLSRLKKQLKQELERAKSDRRKDVIKNLIKEVNGLRKTLGECQQEKVCPHCGGKL